MFSLGIRYLMGWAMAAADGADKKRAEWPPHPDRIFMALAAAWFETGQDVAEGAALQWLEALPAPRLAASGACARELTTHYVPVNDTRLSKVEKVRELTVDPDVSLGKLKNAGLSQLLEFRGRQPRSFPVAIPYDPDVHLIWDEDVPDTHRAPLESLCRKVTSVGHSASVVQMWLDNAPPEAGWVPVAGVAPHRLRVFGPGRLHYLESRFNRERAIAFADLDELAKRTKGKEKAALQQRIKTEFPSGQPTSLRPEPGLWMGYTRPPQAAAPEPVGGVFDHRLIVVSISGKRLSLPATLNLTEALRGALLSACPDPIPEWISGHGASGGASSDPHIAFLPLPFVGAEHADGRVLGVALALPRGLEPSEAERVLEPWLRDEHGLPRTIRLFDGQWLECTVALETRERPPFNLRLETWTGPARRWASVTPVVLDRHFDGPDKWERAAETVKAACERIGLPRPLEVLLHPVSLVEGAPRSSEFPHLARKRDGGRMHHAHVVLVFGEEVLGPVLVGAGRFRGYGVCRPLMMQGAEHA